MSNPDPLHLIPAGLVEVGAPGTDETAGRAALRRVVDGVAVPPDGYTLFSLGPVYVATGCGHDLLEEFRQQGDLFPVLNFQHTQPIFSGIREWDFLLQALPDPLYRQFESFMLSYTLAHTPRRRYFRILRCWCPLRAGAPESAAVFVPSGNVGRVAALRHPHLIAEFVSRAADPQVVAEAEKFFNQVTQ